MPTNTHTHTHKIFEFLSMDAKELTTMMMLNMENNNQYYHHDVDQKTSLGFMELLGFHDYDHSYINYPSSSSIFDMTAMTSANEDDNRDIQKKEMEVDHELVEEESSVVLNGQPSSPNNSCSISSPAHQRPDKHVVEQCNNNNKEKKRMGGDDESETKTKRKKKDKEARFAFMTRTEIDHLDDGYRWRKYGQKAVKNSHFPRSYYRCTNASCNVKKRVERCMGDSSYIITTYEGKHNHPAVINKSPQLINPSCNNNIITTTPLKVEQGAGLLQDMLPYNNHHYYRSSLSLLNAN